jgi:hypothetical protein
MERWINSVSSCANSWIYSIIERSFSNVKDTTIFAPGGTLATFEVLWQDVVWQIKRHFGHSGGTLVVQEVVWKFDRLYIVNSF